MTDPISHFRYQIESTHIDSESEIDELGKAAAQFEQLIQNTKDLYDRKDLEVLQFSFREKVLEHIDNLCGKVDQSLSNLSPEQLHEVLKIYDRITKLFKVVDQNPSAKLFSMQKQAELSRTDQENQKKEELKHKIHEIDKKLAEREERLLTAGELTKLKLEKAQGFIHQAISFFGSLFSPKPPANKENTASLSVNKEEEDEWELVDESRAHQVDWEKLTAKTEQELSRLTDDEWSRYALEGWKKHGIDYYDQYCSFDGTKKTYTNTYPFNSIPLGACLGIIRTLQENWYVFDKPNPFVFQLYSSLKEGMCKPDLLTSKDWLFLTEQFSFYYDKDPLVSRWWKDQKLFAFVPQELKGDIYQVLTKIPSLSRFSRFQPPAEEFARLYMPQQAKAPEIEGTKASKPTKKVQNSGWEAYWTSKLNVLKEMSRSFVSLNQEEKKQFPSELINCMGAVTKAIRESRAPFMYELLGLQLEEYDRLTSSQLNDLTRSIQLAAHPDKAKKLNFQHLPGIVTYLKDLIKQEKKW